MVRHSHEDAVSERRFRELLNTAAQLESPYDEDCQWILIAAGRLGMRAGEICHMQRDWIDFDREVIDIPSYEPCTLGRDGGVCGYCIQQSKQALTYDPSLDLDEVLAERWNPKTDASARAIPYAFDDEVYAITVAYWDDHEQFPVGRTTVNRRIDRLAEAAGMDAERLYPHALRATASTYHAYEGVASAPLQSLMGWCDIKTGQKYIRLSGGATKKALTSAHGDD